MTNKSTTFKRIALALVAALGFGALGSSQAGAYVSNTSSIAISSTSGSAAPGETVTATLTVTFTASGIANETMVVVSDSLAVSSTVFAGSTSDSVNVETGASATDSFAVLSATAPGVSPSVAAYTIASNLSSADVTASAAKLTTAKINVNFRVGLGAAPGIYVQTFTLRNDTTAGTSRTILGSVTYTLTVTQPDTTATAAKSLMWIHASGTAGAAGSSLSTEAMGTPGNGAAISSDSTIVVSAGTVATGAQTYAQAGGVWWDPRNAADTNVAGPATNLSNVTGSLILNISGPGMLTKSGSTTLAKSVTLSRTETAIVWSDGTAGVGTITGYIGSTALTQTAKSVTFFGKATSLTAYETTVIQMGAAALSSNSADSVNVGTDIMYVLAKDAAGNTVRTASMQKSSNFWCISSDTSVASLTTVVTPTDATRPSTAGFVAATAPGLDGFWSCNVRPLKAGSATITFADDTVVANATISAGKTFTFAKSVSGTAAGFKGRGTITFDKATYNVGEKAEITVTVLNADGSVPGAVLTTGDAAGTVFTSLTQNRPFSSVGRGTGNAALGFDTNRDGTTFTLTGGTFFKGVETYTVYMPTTAGALTITGFTTDGTYDTATAVNVSVNVVDPNAALISAAQAAAVAAADAATDAASEAIDAANAATDAANLAAEAADAATVAAEEARDAADAATAAVEELATQVATLMAALKAQITTLANTVAKIAKKVRA